MPPHTLIRSVAMVTGGSRGIGAATARVLAQRGWRVAVLSRSMARAEHMVREWMDSTTAAASDGSLFPVECDVRDAESVRAAVSCVRGAHAHIHALVNAAGVNHDALLVRTQDDAMRATLDTNVLGPLLASREVLRAHVKAYEGCAPLSVVHVGSVAAHAGGAGQCVYAASKAAVHGMTRAMAREYARYGVRVNCVEAGYTETDMTAAMSDDARAAAVASIPLGRMAHVDEVARSIAFLCSDEASYTSGAVMRVAGGL